MGVDPWRVYFHGIIEKWRDMSMISFDFQRRALLLFFAHCKNTAFWNTHFGFPCVFHVFVGSRIEAGGEEMGSLLRLYCVLHALSDIWATQLTPMYVLNSTFVLCFTRFERHPCDTIDSEG